MELSGIISKLREVPYLEFNPRTSFLYVLDLVSKVQPQDLDIVFAYIEEHLSCLNLILNMDSLFVHALLMEGFSKDKNYLNLKLRLGLKVCTGIYGSIANINLLRSRFGVLHPCYQTLYIRSLNDANMRIITAYTVAYENTKEIFYFRTSDGTSNEAPGLNQNQVPKDVNDIFKKYFPQAKINCSDDLKPMNLANLLNIISHQDPDQDQDPNQI
jgi:hypothetical protein